MVGALVTLGTSSTVMKNLNPSWDALEVDASQLGAIADGVLMVVRLGYTPRHYVEQTVNTLARTFSQSAKTIMLWSLKDTFLSEGTI